MFFEDIKIIGKILLFIRIIKNLKQKELAVKFNTSIQNINKIENGNLKKFSNQDIKQYIDKMAFQEEDFEILYKLIKKYK